MECVFEELHHTSSHLQAQVAVSVRISMATVALFLTVTDCSGLNNGHF